MNWEAVYLLRDCHFKVFNELDGCRYRSRAWLRLLKALGRLERAINYLGADLHSSPDELRRKGEEWPK